MTLAYGCFRVACCELVEAAVHAFQLDGCWDWKPLLTGKQVSILEPHYCPSTSKFQLERDRIYMDGSSERQDIVIRSFSDFWLCNRGVASGH